mmetsp:Transcript_23705/g.52973  ORF Transcript_23705/g.52973 Transcript_23705/m.52973 type:complete len:86 (+) Transcript_23705:832-1089(+)
MVSPASNNCPPRTAVLTCPLPPLDRIWSFINWSDPAVSLTREDATHIVMNDKPAIAKISCFAPHRHRDRCIGGDGRLEFWNGLLD